MISATSTLLKSESAMLCSPRITLMLDAAEPSVQCAAVRTWVDEMRVPPHQGICPSLLTSTCKNILTSFSYTTKWTCQGYSCSSVSWPPTIRPLSAPPFTPHWKQQNCQQWFLISNVQGVFLLVLPRKVWNWSHQTDRQEYFLSTIVHSHSHNLASSRGSSENRSRSSRCGSNSLCVWKSKHYPFTNILIESFLNLEQGRRHDSIPRLQLQRHDRCWHPSGWNTRVWCLHRWWYSRSGRRPWSWRGKRRQLPMLGRCWWCSLLLEWLFA